MKKFSLLFIISFLISFVGCSEKKIENITYDEQKNQFSCSYSGESRQFLLCLPENFENKTDAEKSSIPLILMLHGAGGSAEGFKLQTGFDKDACSRNYAVVYVDGTVTENDPSSQTRWHFSNDKQSKNDGNFLVALTQYLKKTYNLNEKIFAAGFSNGGFMITNLASHYSKNFAAVASVAGMMPAEVWETKSKKINTSFLQINGTKDDVVPMNLNGSSKYSRNPAMEDVIDYFVTANGIENKFQDENLSKKVIKRTYDNRICWVLIIDGHHSWPEQKFASIDGNNLILDFFDSNK